MSNDNTAAPTKDRQRAGMGGVPDPRASSAQTASADDFPLPPATTAFHGVAGEIVAAIEPETEAQAVTVLVHLLVAIGSIVGRDVYAIAGGVRHHLNLFAVIVGASSRARKGTAWAAIQPIIGSEHYPQGLDPDWRANRVKSGLSSGEGLKWAVRDPLIKPGEDEPSDAGISDKRLCVIEEEFASVLQVGRREGNTLSSVLRQAWDGKRLDTLTKNDAVTATGAHLSIVGHITREELCGLLTRSDTFNGFANRFLWVASKRARLLPEGGRLETLDLARVLERLRSSLASVRGEMRRDAEAGGMWEEFYARTASVDVPGIVGAVTNRGEPQVLRISALYALLDGSNIIRADHLSAAFAVWDYCEASARWIFGQGTGHPDAEAILSALRCKGAAGMTLTEISTDIFHRNRNAAQIKAALNVLDQAGLAYQREFRETGGAPSHRWYASNEQTK